MLPPCGTARHGGRRPLRARSSTIWRLGPPRHRPGVRGVEGGAQRVQSTFSSGGAPPACRYASARSLRAVAAAGVGRRERGCRTPALRAMVRPHHPRPRRPPRPAGPGRSLIRSRARARSGRSVAGVGDAAQQCEHLGAVSVSSAPVGSSQRISGGSLTRPRAIDTRCCSPPDNCPGKWFSRSPSPTAASTCSVRSRTSARSARRSGQRSRRP